MKELVSSNLTMIISHPPKIGRGWTSSSLSNLKRLKLESLIIKNDDKYIFTYNSVQLPPKTSFALDYWGYYNGQINNKTPFPNPIDFVNSSITYNNIDSMTPELLNKFCGVMFSDDFYCKANILEKIQYPTGGYSKLFYSLNEFNNLSITNNPKYGNLNFVKGNGLRIDSIIHYDNENNRCNQLFYHYIGGKLLNNLSFFYIKNEGYARISNKTLFQCSSDFFNILSNNASTSSPLNDITGVGYDSVYVIQPGEGKTLHTFTNNKEILPQYENKQLSWGFVNILPSYHKGLPNGLLTSELIYDKSDSLKKKTINTYKLIASNYIFYNSKVNYDGFFDLRPREAYHKVEVNYFPIYKTESLLETKEEISIFNGKELINTERYVYNKNNSLVSKYSSMSNLSTKGEILLYPDDFVDSNLSQEHKDVMLSLKNYNRLNEVIRKDDVIYTKGMGTYTKNYIEYDSILLLPNKFSRAIGNNAPFVTESILKYDNNKNIKEVTDKDNITTSYLWGYNNQYLIAVLKNASYSQIATVLSIDPQKIASEPSPDMSVIDGLRAKLPNSLIATYTYSPLIGMTSSTDPRGITTYYEYDGFGRLKCTKDRDGKIIQNFSYHYKP